MTYDDAVQIIDRVMVARSDRYPAEPEVRKTIRHKVAEAVSLLKSAEEIDYEFLLFDRLLMEEHKHRIWQEHQAA